MPKKEKTEGYNGNGSKKPEQHAENIEMPEAVNINRIVRKDKRPRGSWVCHIGNSLHAALNNREDRRHPRRRNALSGVRGDTSKSRGQRKSRKKLKKKKKVAGMWRGIWCVDARRGNPLITKQRPYKYDLGERLKR